MDVHHWYGAGAHRCNELRRQGLGARASYQLKGKEETIASSRMYGACTSSIDQLRDLSPDHVPLLWLGRGRGKAAALVRAAATAAISHAYVSGKTRGE